MREHTCIILRQRLAEPQQLDEVSRLQALGAVGGLLGLGAAAAYGAHKYMKYRKGKAAEAELALRPGSLERAKQAQEYEEVHGRDPLDNMLYLYSHTRTTTDKTSALNRIRRALDGKVPGIDVGTHLDIARYKPELLRYSSRISLDAMFSELSKGATYTVPEERVFRPGRVKIDITTGKRVGAAPATRHIRRSRVTLKPRCRISFKDVPASYGKMQRNIVKWLRMNEMRITKGGAVSASGRLAVSAIYWAPMFPIGTRTGSIVVSAATGDGRLSFIGVFSDVGPSPKLIDSNIPLMPTSPSRIASVPPEGEPRGAGGMFVLPSRRSVARPHRAVRNETYQADLMKRTFGFIVQILPGSTACRK